MTPGAQRMGHIMSFQEAKKAKPDFLDLDGDGNEKESMKAAAADKEDMHEAFAAKNWQAVSDTAHKMKPSLDNMGIHSLRETVRNLEKAKEFTPEKNQENLAYFQIILEKVLEDLKGSLK
jgi:hypothetical protein